MLIPSNEIISCNKSSSFFIHFFLLLFSEKEKSLNDKHEGKEEKKRAAAEGEKLWMTQHKKWIFIYTFTFPDFLSLTFIIRSLELFDYIFYGSLIYCTSHSKTSLHCKHPFAMLLAGGVAASLDAFSECTEVMNEKYVCEAGLVSLEKFQGSRWKFNFKDGNLIGLTKGWIAFLHIFKFSPSS